MWKWCTNKNKPTFKGYLFQLDKCYQLECSKHGNLHNDIETMLTFPLKINYKSPDASSLQPQFLLKYLYLSALTTSASHYTSPIIKCQTHIMSLYVLNFFSNFPSFFLSCYFFSLLSPTSFSFSNMFTALKVNKKKKKIVSLVLNKIICERI